VEAAVDKVAAEVAKLDSGRHVAAAE
jgi:hypothetical protein